MKTILSITFIFICSCISLQSQDTFSIVAVDPETGEVGSAGASCVDLTPFPELTDHFIGELIPGVGAINTQAYYNSTNQENARNMMMNGSSPLEIILWLNDNDVSGQPELRQYGISALVDGLPQTASFTGSATDEYTGDVSGTNYSIQGNILLGPEVLDSMQSRFLNEQGDLACKLMAAMQGANMVGADTRCADNGTSSLFAYVKVAKPGDTFGNPSFVVSVSTEEGDGFEPIDLLQALFDISHECNTVSTQEEVSATSNVRVYPNPAGDYVVVESSNHQAFDLEIVSATGATVHKSTLSSKKTVDISDMKGGVYFLILSNEEAVITKRLVVE